MRWMWNHNIERVINRIIFGTGSHADIVAYYEYTDSSKSSKNNKRVHGSSVKNPKPQRSSQTESYPQSSFEHLLRQWASNFPLYRNLLGSS
jgi:hypothetical protein